MSTKFGLLRNLSFLQCNIYRLLLCELNQQKKSEKLPLAFGSSMPIQYATSSICFLSMRAIISEARMRAILY